MNSFDDVDDEMSRDELKLLDHIQDVASASVAPMYRSKVLVSADTHTACGTQCGPETGSFGRNDRSAMSDRGERIKQENDAFIDKFMAENMMQLSFDDRNQIAEEINGVHCMAPEETPELIESSLKQLAIELESVPFKKKVAYQRSQSSVAASAFVNSDDFRLRFLRTELFDPHEAAIRVVRYLDFALEVFGPYALERPIEWIDFTKQEIKYFQMGYIQWMPFRDKSGRRILVQIIDSNVVKFAITRVKFLIYMLYRVCDNDIESQRKGIVLMVWPGPANDWKTINYKPDKRSRHLANIRYQVTAVRYAAYHFCMNDSPVLRLIRNFIILCGHLSQPRMKVHIGQDTELRYALQGYGICVDLIPVTGTGNIKTQNLRQYLSVRKMIEATALAKRNSRNANYVPSISIDAAADNDEVVECPSSNDVVFKPGKRLMCHPGNVLFQNLILSKTNEYTTSMVSKREIYKWLADEIIRNRGGRFLKWNDGRTSRGSGNGSSNNTSHGYWSVLTDESQINVKISTSYKAVVNKIKKSMNAKKNRTMIESSTFAFNDQQRINSDFCTSSSRNGNAVDVGNNMNVNSKRKRSSLTDEIDDDMINIYNLVGDKDGFV